VFQAGCDTVQCELVAASYSVNLNLKIVRSETNLTEECVRNAPSVSEMKFFDTGRLSNVLIECLPSNSKQG